jgi:raffinose/stachyose/melibiose transport system permease protein
VLATLAYRSAFFAGDVGKATAAACIMSLFGLAATSVYLWLQSRDGAQTA